MRDVQAYIRFGPSGNDTVDFSLLAPAKRHSMLPIDAKIFRLIEKSTVQYQIRDTDYVLEIARYDVYYPKPSRARQAADSTYLPGVQTSRILQRSRFVWSKLGRDSEGYRQYTRY